MKWNTDQTVITMWMPHYPVMPWFMGRVSEVAKAFNEAHPEYRVQIEGFDWNDLPEAVHRATSEGNPPTIAQYFYTSAQEAHDARTADGTPLFTSVERAIDGRTEILGEPVVLDDLLPASRGYYLYDGATAAMPPLTSTTLLYANTTMLRAAGITEVPRTWDEIDRACKAVVDMPGGPSHAITWPNHGWLFQQSVAQQGGLLADHDNGRSGRAETVHLDSDEMMAYVQWWQRLYREGHYLYLYNGTEVDWDSNFQAFADQRVAFVLTTSVEATRMVEAGEHGGFDVKACRMPHNGEVPYSGNVIGGDALWLANGLDESTRDGALAFIQFLNNPANAAKRHRETNFVPVTKGAIELLNDQGWFAENPHHWTAVDQLSANDGTPAGKGALLGDFAAIQKAMTKAMHDVLAGGADANTRFRQATGEAQRLLDNYNEYCLGQRSRGPILVG
ncbi:sn-glycerol 3-phosphate transport system substrate-binding protein [Actinopolyspora lacussalsi subsp. righensis]|uniref:sn-glycerol 3-phosphate transport system substrate-binding protein n=1 Tax=Actinopolyspora righensis TaxID=995060 RepID=A0A1I6XDI7_9ACTN|nr:extracellular solute-binding protein [Actinopolyspora righensis]SFT36183.1 sn-glycerol 3-phosphate transport system substrate-binding protein [Actinopolyspora righensis]